MKDESVWLNREQLSILFDRDVKTIGKHINNALKEELDSSTVAKFATTAKDEKTVKLIDIANRANENLESADAKEILKVIGNYSKALDFLDDYDHRTLLKPKESNSKKQIKYEDCLEIIKKLRFNEESDIFAIERNKGLESIIGSIYQTFDSEDVYKSIEEKAANFLYMIVKNHVFIDGNKRIAATLFIYFLNYYDVLYKDNKQVVDNNTLASLTF